MERCLELQVFSEHTFWNVLDVLFKLSYFWTFGRAVCTNKNFAKFYVRCFFFPGVSCILFLVSVGNFPQLGCIKLISIIFIHLP